MPKTDDGHLSAPEVMTLAEGGLLEASLRKHFDECAECREKVAEWKVSRAFFSGLRSHAAEGPTADCPPIESLLHADALSASENEAIFVHAATCDFCGPLLEELSVASELRTGSSKWQRDLARGLAAGARQTPRRGAWMGIAASVVLVAGGVLWWSYERSARPEVLLARAFTQSRPFEYRLPDAGYSAQDTRRSAGSSSFDKPADLLRAEEEIRRRLSSRPDDAHALVLRGLAEIEDRDYEAAIDSLNHASDITPPDTRALVALGCAYLMRGDVEKRAIDYGHALDFLLKALRQSPRDRAALFNLAIAYEKLSLLDEAAETWRKLLALPADGWSGEAKGRLDHVEQLRGVRRHIEGAVVQDPGAFFARRAAGFRAERYIDIFWSKWLPYVSVNPEARHASDALAAEMERQHGDASVHDALAAARSGRASEALAQVAEVIAKIREGKSDSVLLVARSALPALEAKGQFAAASRLRAEMVYIDRVQYRLPDCLRDADLDMARIRSSPYPSIRAQVQLERGSCLFTLGDQAGARAEFAEAERDLADHGLWRQHLRAAGFLVDADRFAGNHESAWRNGVSGLDSFWKTDAGLLQAQTIQVALEGSAATLGWDNAAAALYGAGARSAALGGHLSLEAACRMDYSVLLRTIGDRAGEMHELDTAQRLFRELPAGPETGSRLAFGRMRRAEAEIEDGRPSIALATLNDLESRPSDLPPASRVELEQARGQAYFAQSSFSTAAARYRKALAIAEESHSLPALESYRGLAQIQLIEGDAPAAFSTWQASRPNLAGGGASAPRADAGPFDLFVSFALLPRGLAVFSKNGSVCRARMVSASPGEVELACRRFVRLCSSPASSREELGEVGRRLYQWLLAPELEGISPGSRVLLQADGGVAGLPFAALTTYEGVPAGERYIIEELSGRFAPSSGSIEMFDSASPALLVSVPSARAPGGARLPLLSAAQAETDDVHGFLSNASVLTDDLATPEVLRAAIPRAAMFHFAGHGWSDGGNGALLLAPGSNGEARYMTAREIAGEDWGHCRLAVLSACLTAAGELQGPINNRSLVRALLTAGAQRVVAAKWSISSEATRPLMKEFYLQLTRGRSVPDALNRAEMALAHQDRWNHPYYWAAFSVFRR